MQISLVPGIEKDGAARFIRADLSVEVIEPNTEFYIPVYQQGTGKTVSYHVEICGFGLQAAKAEQLLPLVSRLLAGLINMARLPTYVFIARHARFIYPVYTMGDEVLATTPGGPVFRHVELANVRQYLSDYLHAVEVLGNGDEGDRLHVRGVNMDTLSLIRPVFYLKKRLPSENEFWAPVFQSDDNRTIYTYAASARREVKIAGGQEVLTLRDLVAQVLIADRRLNANHDLRPDRLIPEYWNRLRVTLRPELHRLVVADKHNESIELPIFSNSHVMVAVEKRRVEDRWSLFVGSDPRDLGNRVAVDFQRRGIIGDKNAIRVMIESGANER